jgi:aerobic carbon-monoxide dehydrogenase small subunit
LASREWFYENPTFVYVDLCSSVFISGSIMTFRFVVNSVNRAIDVPPMKRLLDVLREDLRLTGTKEGCGEGECGACSVIVDGEVINSCLVPVCQVNGATILTVEGLARDGRLDPLQQAFLECGGAQCGICTPGMLIAARALLDENSHPSRNDIKEAIAGNLCRCTGYVKIIDAIQQASMTKD